MARKLADENNPRRGGLVGVVEYIIFQMAATLVRVLASLNLMYQEKGESEEANRFATLANKVPEVSMTNNSKRKAQRVLSWYKDR